MNERLEPIVGISLSPDEETQQGKAFRFTAILVRQRAFERTNFNDFPRTTILDGEEALVAWIRKALAPPTETP